MTEYQNNVLSEKAALDTRLQLLELFLESEDADRLSQYDTRLLIMQYNAMQSYSIILGLRIDKFAN